MLLTSLFLQSWKKMEKIKKIMTKEEIKEIIKQDLRLHPEKRNSFQFCVACAAYGVDLLKIDEEFQKEND